MSHAMLACLTLAWFGPPVPPTISRVELDQRTWTGYSIVESGTILRGLTQNIEPVQGHRQCWIVDLDKLEPCLESLQNDLDSEVTTLASNCSAVCPEPLNLSIQNLRTIREKLGPHQAGIFLIEDEQGFAKFKPFPEWLQNRPIRWYAMTVQDLELENHGKRSQPESSRSDSSLPSNLDQLIITGKLNSQLVEADLPTPELPTRSLPLDPDQSEVDLDHVADSDPDVARTGLSFRVPQGATVPPPALIPAEVVERARPISSTISPSLSGRLGTERDGSQSKVLSDPIVQQSSFMSAERTKIVEPQGQLGENTDFSSSEEKQGNEGWQSTEIEQGTLRSLIPFQWLRKNLVDIAVKPRFRSKSQERSPVASQRFHLDLKIRFQPRLGFPLPTIEIDAVTESGSMNEPEAP